MLAEVKRQMPEVEAVCSGAVLSNYQRVRVEEVCGRLGLTSLAFLWQRGQRELLNEMIGAGVVAIVVKTASMGLKPSHLGRTIGELAPVFERLNEQFGFHECGEGGEYETFTLDCPLFKRRIELVGSSVVRHAADVALLSISAVELRSKEATTEAVQETVDEVLPAEEERTAAAAAAVTAAAVGTAEPAWEQCCRAEEDAPAEFASPAVRCVELGNGFIHAATYGSTRLTPGAREDEDEAEAAALQLVEALGRLQASLEAQGLDCGS